MRYHCTPAGMAKIKRMTIPNAEENVETHLGLPFVADRSVKWYACSGKLSSSSLKFSYISTP